MSETRKILLSLLEQKAALKQDIADDGEKVFTLFKKVIHEEINALKSKVNDKRIRLFCEEKGKYEIYVYIGSDVLVFHLHNNIFRLPDEDGMWNHPFYKSDENRAYFSLIYVYNFLAESFLQNRMGDVGYLINRIQVNKDRNFLVEGIGQLGSLFRDPEMKLDKQTIQIMVQMAFSHAIGFDLLIPPYEMMAELEVSQILQISDDLQIKTGKRLGFKRKEEEEENI